MMKTNFTFYNKLTRPLIVVFGLMLLNLSTLQAQCSLGCNQSINVSLDTDDCAATVTPADLLTDSTTCPGGVFTVELRHNGHLIPGVNTITAEFVGKKLEAKVIDATSGNSCWGYINVEDYLAPVIDCTPPGDLYCYQSATFVPDVDENCGSYKLYTLDSFEVTNDCSGILASNILKRVTKVYKAIDLSGNESAVCTISYNVLKLDDLSTIIPPKNFLYPSTSLMCDATFIKLPNGNPSPETTGYPRLDTVNLKPGSFSFCNLIIDYKDEILKDNGCIKKIGRTWKIYEWSCNAPAPREILQMIEIADNNKPVITGVKDITVSTTPHHCDAYATIPAAIVSDACSSVTVTISGGTPLIVGNGGQTTLPVGVNTITYVASDACGNTSSAQITVTVEDLTPPVPVCDQNTTVSVTTDGLAWVPASVFDDGSYDECALAKMLVRRMGDDVCSAGAPQFDDFISLGEHNNHYYVLSKHKIESRLANKHGIAIGGYLNISDLSAERTWINNAIASINDTLGYLTHNTLTGKPAFVDIANGGILVNNLDPNAKYNYVIEINKVVGEHLWSSYAKFCCVDKDVMVAFRVVDKACNYNDCMVNVTVQDKLPPAIVCPDSLVIACDAYYPTGNLVNDYGNYVVTDNCENPTITDVITTNNVNQCNVGNIVRTITATDGSGRSATCTQYIQITGKMYNFDSIRYPADVTLTSCADPSDNAFKPENTNGYPVFVGDNQCNLLGADYEDFVYTFNNSNGEACFKIVRRWTVLDWCNYNGHSYYSYPHYDQLIKVNDSTKPVITSSCAPKSTCTYDASCTDGFIELTATATDECTDVLDYTFQIDLNNDGTYETGFYKNQPLSKTGKANALNASGNYPIGTHKIRYTFADKCGNVTACEQVFTIVNCKAPTPYCLNGLAVDLMPVDENNDGTVDGGMVALWASDFDAGSFHTCPGYKVYVSFSKNILDTGRVFTCADLGRADVRVYASIITPMGDTISSYCNTFVDVQDNMNACNNRVGISGIIATADSRRVADAEVVLQGIETSIVMSNVEGEYSFGQMPIGGDYDVYPVKNDNPINGVSTLDLVLIQRHILNISTLSTPHYHIAADVNKDGRISASDLVELRKLILGVTSEFTNNNSWRFIDADTQFPAGENPLDISFDESYAIDGLNSDMVVDFTSIKVGDVNGNVKTNIRATNSEPRSNTTLELFTDNTKFEAGDDVSVKLSSENVSINGAQFTINFDSEKLRFTGIEGNGLNVSEDNFGMTHLDQGRITFSWNSSAQVSISDLFTLKFTALTNGEVSNNVNITSEVTQAEAYNDANEVMNIEFRTVGAESGLVLYQNIPNPFNNNTIISFNMPTTSNATLSILDVTGKIVYSNTTQYQAGVNSITINKNEMKLSGIMYYQLTVNNETLVKKMVVIE